MDRKLFFIIAIFLLTIVSAAAWYFLPDGKMLWIKFTILSIALIGLIAIGIIWVKSRRGKLSAQQILLKQDVQCIQQLFKVAVQKIIEHRQDKSSSLYDLPWYLVIGGGNEGKSSLLQQNGMELLLSQNQNVSDTEHYIRFWIHDTAIVLEVGHRLFDNEGVDRQLWHVLSQQLIKYRPRQGLNGVILVLGSDRLLNIDNKDLHGLARLYREAILLLKEHLQIALPLYVTISKADLLSDFTRFFENFSDSEIMNPFGITLPDNDTHRFDRKNFQLKTEQLLKSMVNNQFELLNNRDTLKSASIIRLPYQLRIFFSRVEEFFSELGRENQTRQNIWIRGVYLFSAGQKGMQYDLLTQVIAEQAEFNSRENVEQPVNRRVYFSSRILSHAILPEKNLTGINRKRNAFYLAWSTTFLVAATVLVVMMGLTLNKNWQQEIVWNNNAINKLSYYSSNVYKLKTHDSLRDTVAILSDFRNIANYDVTQEKWYNRISTKQDNTVLLIKNSYYHQLNSLLYPKIIALVSDNLRVNNMAHDLNDNFRDFRFYQMLFDRQKMHLVNMQAYLHGIIQREHLLSPAESNDFALLVNDLFSGNYGNGSKPDATLSAAAMRAFNELSPEKLIYMTIKELPSYDGQVNIKEQLGDKFDTLFEFKKGFKGYVIPQLYTKQSYDKLDLSVKSSLLRQQLKYFKSINGDDSNVSFSELSELSKNIQKLYFADYIYYWQNIINNIQVHQANDLAEFSLMLESARDPVNSPILNVLETIVENTTLVEKRVDTPEVNKVASQLGLPKTVTGLQNAGKISTTTNDGLNQLQHSFSISNVFSSYFDYLNGSVLQTGKPPITELIQQVDNLDSFFDAALLSAEPGKVFNNYALNHAQGSDDAIRIFQQVSGKAPEPFLLWLTNISQQAWQQVINGNVSYLNDQWNEHVYQFYASTIKGRFPFSPQGRGEVALHDFTELFKPSGKIDRFIEQYIKSFARWDNGQFKLNDVDGLRLPISQQMLHQMDNMYRLRQVFFGESGQQLALKLSLRADSMSTALTEFQLRQDELIFSYRQGPRLWREISWPNDGRNNPLSAIFYKNEDKVASHTYSGEWALFRMIFDGVITVSSSNAVTNVYYGIKDNKISLVYTLHDSPYALDKNLFQTFALPETL